MFLVKLSQPNQLLARVQVGCGLCGKAEHYRLLRKIKVEHQSARWFQLPKLTLLLKQLAHFHPVLPIKVTH